MEELKQSELGQKQPKKKSLKWLWIAIALIVVAGIAVWCTLNAIKIDGTLDSDGKVIQGLEKALTLGAFLCGLFLITTLGYMLGRITIKGVSLGTAGVFLVAILFGFLCTLIPE
ncbi:MAG: hypothetical protein IJX16_07585, partial [Clostridia bacterium]|nr:hypothetical protein [Clostridia bacterium]